MERNILERLQPYEKEGFEMRHCHVCEEFINDYKGRFLYYEIDEKIRCRFCVEYFLNHHPLLQKTSKEKGIEQLLEAMEDKDFSLQAKEVHRIKLFRDTLHEDLLRLNNGSHFAKIKGILLYHPVAAKSITKETKLYAVREPFNEVNVNAIALFIEYNGSKEKIGYLPVGLCEELAPIMDYGDEIKLFVEDVTTRKVRRTSYVDREDAVYLEHYHEEVLEIIVHIKNVIDTHPLYRLKRLFE